MLKATNTAAYEYVISSIQCSLNFNEGILIKCGPSPIATTVAACLMGSDRR